ncbi:MAG: peptidase T [Candidatus Lokiarchaeota archaeon]|nr:peptidase T [Candidatus Lokiarchaeota archaeon]
MELSKEIQTFLLKETVKRFCDYVKIGTSSSKNSSTIPSTSNQIEFGKILVKELIDLGLKNVIQDEFGYVYANVPASNGLEHFEPIGFIAHLDTSPAVSGENVVPVIHENYDGREILFSKNQDLSLSIKDSHQLEDYIGLDIITSQGNTLLGADDKAGIAEIVTACAAWKKYKELKHGPIVVCFTPDEEIGKGTIKINKDYLPKICYTMDGSEMGKLEIECFDAWNVTIEFRGLSVHPGHAKGLMVNAIHLASRFLAEIPESESPERTEGREGFYHLSKLSGTEERAIADIIIRDYEENNNQKRMEHLKTMKSKYEQNYKGLQIDLNFSHQYQNMKSFLEKEEKAIDMAKKAIEQAGIDVNVHSIRGGTDGAALSAQGIPTPNIFAGGLLFHSKKEYIPTLALQKATEVILNLARLWSD